MNTFSPNDITIILFDIGILLGLSLFLGEIARRYRQPMVVGEILAGVILGPTVLGTFAPELWSTIFPARHNTMIAMEGITTIAVVLLLLVAGIEISLPSVWKQRKTAFLVSTMGILIPFGLGFGASWYFSGFFGMEHNTNALTFSLFLGTALSISALPVIAKTLMDMNLLKSEMGTLVMASAALNDLVGWIIFSVVISFMTGNVEDGHSTQTTILFTAAFTVFMLTFVRWALHRILPWLERRTVWPGGMLGFVFALTMIGAAVTEWIGIHAVFGAFLVGIAAGDTRHLSERTKDVISQFATNIFAPLFFAYIGLRINFAAHFDLPLILAVFGLACIGKIVGCTAGAFWSGISGKESLAVGFGMNARGAMEIILGLLALEYGLINENLFVALVIMAIGTTMLSGPMMEWFIREKKPLKVISLLKPAGFVSSLRGTTPKAVITELAEYASHETGLESKMIFDAVWEREQIIGTALGGGVAVPHSRLIEISTPVIIAGISEKGIDFNAMDGAPVKIIFFLLTPRRDQGAQLQILADIARTFSKPDIRAEALNADDYESFIEAIRIDAESA
ncbi:cation:proton antiporter [Candidatus Latescibacterota bacterium]